MTAGRVPMTATDRGALAASRIPTSAADRSGAGAGRIVKPAADRRALTASSVKDPTADRRARAAGRIVEPTADCGKGSADLVLSSHYKPSEAGEIVPLPHHHIVRARVHVLPLARLVVAHQQVTQPIGGRRRPQAIHQAQVRPRDDHLVVF